MDNLISALLLNPTEERSITIKTKPEKKEAPPEAPIDSASANLPQAVLDMLGMGAGASAPPTMAGLPPELLQLLMSGGGAQGFAAPPMDPMAGQMPMNPYGV